MRKILVATTNQGKLEEFKRLFESADIEFIGYKELFPSLILDEPFHTYAENARFKAMQLSHLTNLPVLADDSGLEINSLPTILGVHSARYEPKLTYQEKCEKILSLMAEMENRLATFTSSLTLIIPNQEIVQVEAYVQGTISKQITGVGGFGFDPIFIPNGQTKTYATMTIKEKNVFSHRARAATLLNPFMVLVKGN